MNVRVRKTLLETTVIIAACPRRERRQQGLIDGFVQEMDTTIRESEVAAALMITGETAPVKPVLRCSAGQGVRTVDPVGRVVDIVSQPEPAAKAPLVPACHFTRQQRVAGFRP